MLQRTNISVIRYHAYKVKVPVGTQVTFRKDVTVPSYEKILAKHGELIYLHNYIFIICKL